MRFEGYRTTAARILTCRYTLIAISAFFLIVSIYTICKAFALLMDDINNLEGIDDLYNGLGTIFIAYGVALEGRSILMTFFGLYPKYQNEKEETVDQICEDYGLLLLIGGLCMEVAAEMVVIPSRFLDLKDVETGVFVAGFIFWLMVVYLMVRKAMHLIACRPDYRRGSEKLDKAAS